MTTLNDIPDYLKAPRGPEGWTPGRGLVTGSICVAIAVTILTTAAYWITYWVPVLTGHWLLGIAGGFVITWTLFAVMHRNSGLVCGVQIPIVLVGVIVVGCARYLGYLAFVAGAQEPVVSLWVLFRSSGLVLSNLFVWVGAAMATHACKDGNSIAHGMADMAMTNPFTGRRV